MHGCGCIIQVVTAGMYGKPNGRADEPLISETKRVMLTRDCGIPEMTPDVGVQTAYVVRLVCTCMVTASIAVVCFLLLLSV